MTLFCLYLKINDLFWSNTKWNLIVKHYMVLSQHISSLGSTTTILWTGNQRIMELNSTKFWMFFLSFLHAFHQSISFFIWLIIYCWEACSWNDVIYVIPVNTNRAPCGTLTFYVGDTVFVPYSGSWWILIRGGTRMGRRGIRLVHGLTKSTLIMYFSGMKIDPKYAFLHAFFLICLSCLFQNLSIWPKTHPFFQFCTFLHP